MATETDQPVDIQQVVKGDMAKFLAESRGRPAYDDTVFKKPESLPAAMRIIRDYLGSGRPNINSLEKMVDYAVDVYDQGVGFAVMSREYPFKVVGDEGENLYLDVRQAVISFLKAYRPDSWGTDWQAFIRLFTITLPRRLEPSDFRRWIWNILYGEGTDEAGLPDKMPRERKEAYIRQQIEKL